MKQSEKAKIWQVYVADGDDHGIEFWCHDEADAKRVARKLRKRRAITHPAQVVIGSAYLEVELARSLLKQYSATNYIWG